MKPTWLNLLLLSWGAWLAVPTARAQELAPVLVIEVSEADHAAAQRFLALSERPTQLLRAEQGREPAAALALVREAAMPDAVVFDQARAQVSVLRAADGALWTRTLDPASETPFVAAFLAVELLALSTGSNVSAAPAAEAPRWGLQWIGLRLGGAALFSAPYASGRVELGMLAAVGAPNAAFSWLFELFAAPRAKHAEALGPGRLQLARSDLAARVGGLWQRRFGIAAFAQAGLSVIDAKYARTHDHALRALLGLGVEPNLQLAPWLRIYASGVLTTALPRGEYRFGASNAVRDGALGVQLGGGLWFTLPVR